MNWAALVKAYKIYKIFVSMLPIVQQFVVTLGAMFPEGGHGAEKLDQVKTWVEDLFSTLQSKDAQFSEVWAKLEPWITALVAKYNKQGWPVPVVPSAPFVPASPVVG
jgi:hypothetical protein